MVEEEKLSLKKGILPLPKPKIAIHYVLVLLFNINRERKPFKTFKPLKFVPPHFNRGKITFYIMPQNMCHGKRDTKMKLDIFPNQKNLKSKFIIENTLQLANSYFLP